MDYKCGLMWMALTKNMKIGFESFQGNRIDQNAQDLKEKKYARWVSYKV